MTNPSYLSRLYQFADMRTPVGRQVKAVADKFLRSINTRQAAMLISAHTGRTTSVADDIDFTTGLLYPLSRVSPEHFKNSLVAF
jgi:hypothetical protein